MKILVTGVAGFIGFHVANKLLDQDIKVIGIDNLNDYYDVNLKKSRLQQLNSHPNQTNFDFIKLDIADKDLMSQLFAQYSFDRVIHLAAQAGVRYSIENPHAYVQSNLVGFTNILEGCRNSKVQHLIYASSSSVYGGNKQLPFSESEPADSPISFYAATKRANELMAHSYTSLYGLHTTGLRFFTVYGPWGRPDMALFKFTKAILSDGEIDVFNYGKHLRDFTYIDDIVSGILKVAETPNNWQIFNIGNNNPVKLERYISVIEKNLRKKARINFLPLQNGDVPDTYADVSKLQAATNYRSTTTVEDGIKKFLDWYMEHYAICVE